MPAAPRLTDEQRALARERALQARTARAEAKAGLKSGRLGAIEFLLAAQADSVLGSMRVREFLAALPGIGDARTAALLAELHIAESRRLTGLGPKQRAALLHRLGYPAESLP